MKNPPSYYIQTVVVIGATFNLVCDCGFKLRTSAAAARTSLSPPLPLPGVLPGPLTLPNVLPGPPTFAFGFVADGSSALAIRDGTEAFALDCGGGAPTVRPTPWKLSSDCDPQQLPICALRWWRCELDG